MKTSLTGIEIAVLGIPFTGKAALVGDVYTLGFGATKSLFKKPIKAGEEITREKALELYRHQNLSVAETNVLAAFDLPNLSQNQFDALVSLYYDIGHEKFIACGIVAAIGWAPKSCTIAEIFIALAKNEIGERTLDILEKRLLQAGHYYGFKTRFSEKN